MAINRVTELDFDQIKKNLKSYLQSQDEFNDFDFDGAGISVLLDLLAYNTQYNAVLSHVIMNEAFLDSAELRANVVSHSKLIGYTPRSSTSSKIFVDINITGTSGSPDQIELTRGTQFRTTIFGVTYNFVNLDSIVANKDLDNNYSFTSVQLNQGKLKSKYYRVDGTIDYQKFVIIDDKIDTDSLVISVYESESASTYEDYTFYEDITQVNSESTIYYLQENGNGYYEIYFGDGILGKQLSNNNVVEVQYLATDGAAGNGGNTFTAINPIAGLTGITVSISDGYTQSFNGAQKESVESIRFNAPLYYSSQNRAVTSRDYKSIIMAEYPDIQDVSIWGGELNDPPVYGKVFVSLKVENQDYISQERKEIIQQYIQNKNVGSITTEILDPDYTKLIITSLFKYDSEKTNRSKSDLETLVYNTINSYNEEYLNKFDGVFRSSNLISDIDDIDIGILNNVMRIKMYKEIIPNTLFDTSYDVIFSSPIYISNSSEKVLDSTVFTINNIECKFGDEVITGTTNRRIYVYSVSSGTKLSGYENVGIIYPAEGKVLINSIRFESTTPIEIICSPESNDIAPKFNQLIQIDLNKLTISSELDTISIYGTAGATNYSTFSRHD